MKPMANRPINFLKVSIQGNHFTMANSTNSISTTSCRNFRDKTLHTAVNANIISKVNLEEVNTRTTKEI